MRNIGSSRIIRNPRSSPEPLALLRQPGARAGNHLTSHVQILDLERMLLDELSARLDVVTHQGREQVISRRSVVEPDLE